MVGQSGSEERTVADMILEQFAEAEKKFRAELETLEADLSRLTGEIKTLAQELEALEKEPGDHQKEIDEIEKKIAEKQAAVAGLVDEIKARNLVYQTQIELLTKLLNQWNNIIKNAADKVGR